MTDDTVSLDEDSNRLLIETDDGKNVVSYVLMAVVDDPQGRQHIFQSVNEKQTGNSVRIFDVLSAVEKAWTALEFGTDD